MKILEDEIMLHVHGLVGLTEQKWPSYQSNLKIICNIQQILTQFFIEHERTIFVFIYKPTYKQTIRDS